MIRRIALQCYSATSPARLRSVLRDSCMTQEEFRNAALSLPETAESAHMAHPDFRVKGKIFATLGYPDGQWGTLMLTPEQQRVLVAESPDSFRPVAGAWGAKGSTSVRLDKVDEALLARAMAQAWANKAPKRLAATYRAER